LYVFKYRLPLKDKEKITVDTSKLRPDDIIQIKFNTTIDLPEDNKEALFKNISNYLLTKVDLTQDIQKIRI